MRFSIQLDKFSVSLYGCSICLLPILFQYTTPIVGLTIGDVFFCLSLVLMLLCDKNIKYHKSLLIIIAYVIILTLSKIYYDQLFKITTSLRYIIYLIGMMFMADTIKCRDLIINFYNKTSFLVMIFMIFQYIILKSTGRYISGVITWLPLTDLSLLDFTKDSVPDRCMSVFGEPSHYAIFMVLYLLLKLFLIKTISIKNLLLPIIITISILLSASFTGVITSVFIWIVWLVSNMFNNRNFQLRYLVIICLMLSVAFAIWNNTDSSSYIQNSEIYERQSDQRLTGYDYYEQQSASATLFGHGMNDMAEYTYMAGWVRLIYYYGYVGGLLYILSFIFIGKTRTISFFILILSAFLMIATEVNFNPLFMPYVLLVSNFNRKN